MDDEDIELDDDGNNIIERKEMFENFYKFDCFLMQNREKIDLNESEIETEKNNESSSGKSNNSLRDSLPAEDNKAKKARAFFCLKDVKIDYEKVARNIATERDQDINNSFADMK